MLAELGVASLCRHQHSPHFIPQPKAFFFRNACPQSGEDIEDEVKQVLIV